MWDVVLDSLIDTLKLAPFLFLIYVLIEVIEEYSFKNAHHKILKSKYSVLFGAGISTVPQCGFSVVASELYAKRRITLGTLFAVFIATSDEALAILLSTPRAWKEILPIILIKVVWAIIIGYSVDIIFHFVNKRKRQKFDAIATKGSEAKIDVNSPETTSHEHDHEDCEHDENDIDDIHIKGCCGHDVENEKSSTLTKFLWHPLVHTLKILLFILIVNLIFGTIVYFVTEERLINALSTTAIFQPLIASAIGLIPNCAASVIMTDLFIRGGLTLGGIIAGLCVNSGIGMLYLFKNNKHIRENILIMLTIFVLSVGLGMFVDFIYGLII